MLFFSDFQHTYIWLPFIGFLIGILATMLGSGGGLFFPLILILLFQVPAHIAVTTSLAAGLPLAFAGATNNYRKGNVAFQMGSIFGIGGIAGAIVGTAITRLISQETLKDAFGIYSFVLALLILRSIYRNGKHFTKHEKSKPSFLSKGRTVAGLTYGFAGGAVSGTFGTNGAAPVLAGLFSLNLPVRLAVGTSLMVVSIITLSALLGHFFIGVIDLTLVLFLSLGSVSGAWIGAHLLTKVRIEIWEKQIKYAFVIIIISAGVMLIL